MRPTLADPRRLLPAGAGGASLEGRLSELSRRNTALLLTLVDNLFIRPVVTISDAAKIMGVTYQAAQHSVQKLVDAKILDVLPERTPATFIARKILSAVNPPPSNR